MTFTRGKSHGFMEKNSGCIPHAKKKCVPSVFSVKPIHGVDFSSKKWWSGMEEDRALWLGLTGVKMCQRSAVETTKREDDPN